MINEITQENAIGFNYSGFFYIILGIIFILLMFKYFIKSIFQEEHNE